jgi:hypothetical protein
VAAFRICIQIEHGKMEASARQAEIAPNSIDVLMKTLKKA